MLKNKNTISVVISITIFMFSNMLYAQENDSHQHASNEIGLSGGANYDITHREWRAGLHLHYFRTIKAHSPWALGIGAEYIIGDESHYGFNIGARYQVCKNLQISLMPGIIFIPKPLFSIHAEVVYELIHWGPFHLGPVVGYAWGPKHADCSIGIHAAFAFQ